ncbi:hypothetical protein TRFO_14504 [Tritrichomonas foetus]|uniref:SUN domain-containing protein n=1 Tax=Tritrichomonas foetus TaxID=1144522 RepID=A0A1J4KZ78_9EUKA|nr:hypothetical protein TRFO_14504 [Tritrichomonas foetus]|eukprot:OHT15014.1 hypothetical protein TRFO_14504 [Tritrichomonas foetus]
MIFVYFLCSFVNSLENCESNDYFCQSINEIEKRMTRPQKNASQELTDKVDKLVTLSKENIHKLNESSEGEGLDELADNLTNPSTMVASYLFSRQDGKGKKETAPVSKRIWNVISHDFPEIPRDFNNGWKIDDNRGYFSFLLNKEIPSASKVVIPYTDDNKCTIKKFFIVILDNDSKPTRFGPFELEKGTSSAQEFVLTNSGPCKSFRIEVADNHGGDFTCLVGAEVFQA